MTTLTFSRSNLAGGFHQAVALIRVIARAFTFASLVFSVLFAFLYVAAPSILRSLARSAALHRGAITVWAAIFLVLMAMYLARIVISALGDWLDRLCERSPKVETAITASLTLIAVAFLGFIAYGSLFERVKSPPVPAPAVLREAQPSGRVLLHFWTHRTPAEARQDSPPPWKTTNVVGAAKIERLGPGHYQVWVHKEGGE
ncbi:MULTISPECIES: hypothetical protein [Acidithiobacillus]|jgi:hypothetical protein|uniref:Uncharacterized protein n=2 Tax=Acidithiobacillus TaxID=119977 RepID=A0A179BIS7_ACIFR|nr:MULTISPECIES: hypothetical protein [Acidithiobacillus]MBU2846413.1 hypothetical protein [Acidithiobacillus ferriphilus]MEB8474448.1 hypothetical protein [Acidithiobacillus ferriphilus]MEB8488347.1 hypothetical protein [Acidithiobacillus ferriphilus]MEB8490672.1 hypothetical protein [Acidithiobacillus ferriphilus]MEB8493568.1 hypothetical protein [Acidithiobacillus ferriphilus]